MKVVKNDEDGVGDDDEGVSEGRGDVCQGEDAG